MRFSPTVKHLNRVRLISSYRTVHHAACVEIPRVCRVIGAYGKTQARERERERESLGFLAFVRWTNRYSQWACTYKCVQMQVDRRRAVLVCTVNYESIYGNVRPTTIPTSSRSCSPGLFTDTTNRCLEFYHYGLFLSQVCGNGLETFMTQVRLMKSV